AAWDQAAPGAIHRVYHERLVADTRGEVCAMLDYLGLPFEPATLEFHRNARAVRTASSEQVRRPINRDGMDQWQAFAAWL
ncbi:sulfotransferase, partial [Klebsiella pneumoniae]|uniref:sulfotransferase n=1 Tax=Klebsiella pneumoniae TaxID=573 RepID=UPI0038540C3D